MVATHQLMVRRIAILAKGSGAFERRVSGAVAQLGGSNDGCEARSNLG